MNWLWRHIADHGHYARPSGPSQSPSVLGDEATPEGVFRSAAARQLDTQITTNDILDTRNMTIVGIGSTILPVTFGLLSIGQVKVPQKADWLLVIAVVWYGALLLSSWWASRYRGLSLRPDLRDLRRYSETYSGPLLEQWLAIEYTRSADENSQFLNRKARWVGAANTLLYLEGLSLSIAAVWTLL
jgi:hypothetical protein